MTVTTTSGIIPSGGQQIIADALFVARETTIMSGLVKPYSATGFMVRTVPIHTTLTAQTVSEGVDYTNAQAFNDSSQATYTPIRKAIMTVLTDQRMATDPQNAMQAASLELGQGIALAVDTELCAYFDDFSVSMGTAGSTLTLAHVGAALARIRNANAQGQRYVVLHPYQWHDIWTGLGNPAATYTFQGEIANEALRQHFVGAWLAAQWFMSSNIAANTSDDAYGAAFVREAIGLDTRKAPTLYTERNNSQEAEELYMTTWYATAVERNTFGVGLLSDVTAPTG